MLPQGATPINARVGVINQDGLLEKIQSMEAELAGIKADKKQTPHHIR
jgi:hypothetical protein